MALYASVVLSGWGSLHLSAWTTNVSPFWPATGLATGFLVLTRLRLWPVVFLGALTTELLVPYPLPLASGIAAGSTLEAVLGAWIILRLSGPQPLLAHLARPLSVILAAGLAPVLSAAGGTACLRLAGLIPAKAAGSTMLTWWAGDALGLLLLAPFFLPADESSRRFSPRQWFARGSLVLGVTLFVSWPAFFLVPNSGWIFCCLPVLLLAVLLLGTWGARLACLVMALISIMAAIHGEHPLTYDSPADSVLLIALFIGLLAITAQFLPALLSRESRLIIPTLVLLSGWGLSAGLYVYFKQQRVALDDQRFTKGIAETENAITFSLAHYVSLLRGAAGLVDSLTPLDQATWSAYVQTLNLRANYPGMSSLGLIVPDPAAPDRLTVTLTEPSLSKVGMSGPALATHPRTLTAAEQARDTGQPRITRRIMLPHRDTTGPGFLLLLPVYHPGRPLTTTAERRTAFRGWIFAPFVTEIFMKTVKGALDHSTGLHLFDDETAAPGALIYAANPPAPGEPLPRLEKITPYTLGGLRLTNGWRRDARFARSSAAAEVWAGSSLALVTLLLAGLVVNLEATGRRAQQLADDRTRELQAANARLQTQIVARTQVEATLVRAKEAAESASRAKGEFLATMSHELRTPMNSVLGFAELLQFSVQDPKHSEWIRLQRQSGEHLLGIINGILDFTKIEAGQLELQLAPLHLRDLVDQVLASFLTQAAAKQIRLELDASSLPDAPLLGDSARIRQILVNLVGNALKFTSTGTVHVSLVWQPGPGDTGNVHVAVTDTGPGIAAADQGRLFQMFTQVDSSVTRRHGGTGLGLAISRRLVELMGGKIGLISEPGHGSTFWFDLPLSREPRPLAPPPPLTAPAPAAPAPALAHLRVLVADDDAFNRILAASVLESAGIHPTIVNGGLDTLAAVARQTYDVLLLDCRMPDLDGYAVARELRRQPPRDQPLRIIGLTANALPEDRQRCLDAGMDDYLAKPFKLQELLRLLQPAPACPPTLV